MSKADIRKQLEAGMTLFLSNGGSIKKMAGRSNKKSQMEREAEDVMEIEIEIDHLPSELRKKHFPND